MEKNTKDYIPAEKYQFEAWAKQFAVNMANKYGSGSSVVVLNAPVMRVLPALTSVTRLRGIKNEIITNLFWLTLAPRKQAYIYVVGHNVFTARKIPNEFFTSTMAGKVCASDKSPSF